MSCKIYKVSSIKGTNFKQNESFKGERTASEVYSVIDNDDHAVIDFGLNDGISPEVNSRLNQIYCFLKDMNIDDVHIAAIMGNIKAEAGDYFDPCANTERLFDEEYPSNIYLDQRTGEEIIKFDMSMADDPQYRANAREELLNSHAVPLYGGIGLIQWTGGIWDEATKSWISAKTGADRKALFLNWCNNNNLNWYEMDTQLRYILKEYSVWSLKGNFESIQNVDEAAKFFCDYYEKPDDDTAPVRIEYARDFLNIFNNNFACTSDPSKNEEAESWKAHSSQIMSECRVETSPSGEKTYVNYEGGKFKFINGILSSYTKPNGVFIQYNEYGEEIYKSFPDGSCHIIDPSTNTTLMYDSGGKLYSTIKGDKAE